jgi:hypothetical protein
MFAPPIIVKSFGDMREAYCVWDTANSISARLLTHLGQQSGNRHRTKADCAIGYAEGNIDIIAQYRRAACVDDVGHIALPVALRCGEDWTACSTEQFGRIIPVQQYRT